MKRLYGGMLIMLACLCLAAPVLAADAPIMLTHSLTSSVPGTGTSSHRFAIHLVNRGDFAVNALQLKFLPAPPFIMQQVVLNLGALGPHQSTDAELVLLAPPLDSLPGLDNQRLFFTGSYLDARGKPVSFPAISYPSPRGGVR